MEEIELLKEAEGACARRLVETGRDIAGLLAADLASYPERELRRRFVGTPAVAEAMDQATLVRLRLEARELGTRLADETRERLGLAEAWLDLAAEPLPSGKDLRVLAGIWREVAAADAEVETLAAGALLPPDDRDPPGYAPPARFIEVDGRRKYLPQLVEQALREASELRRLRAEIAAHATTARSEALSDRWERAAPPGAVLPERPT